MRQPEITPDLRPASYVDQVYGRVLTMISVGEFTTGDRLPSEARLGDLFGVSRPVIRDALARLRQDGLIEARKGSGTYVRAQPPEDLATLTRWRRSRAISGFRNSACRSRVRRQPMPRSAGAMPIWQRSRPRMTISRQRSPMAGSTGNRIGRCT